MVKDIDKIWSDLLSEKTDELHEPLRLRLIHKFGLRIGLDLSTHNKVALIELPSNHDLEARLLPLWTGMEISINQIGDKQDMILFRLTGEEDELFDYMITRMYEMFDSLGTKDDIDSNILNFLDRLDSFFKNYRKGLSETQQQGLYGELYFLLNILFQKIEPVYALDYWRGHKREHQDFLFPRGNVEVKTTAQKEHKKLTITSEKQLDERGLKSLFIYALCLKKLDNAGESLNEIVEKVRLYLSEKYMDLNKFNRFLNDAGYFDEHANIYTKLRYIVDEELLFEVSGDFPRIIDLPNGVGMNSYTIAISACKEYLVDINDTLKGLL